MSLKRRLADTSGQSLVEFAIVLPIAMLLTLGVVEVGYALYDQHVITRLTREGSNLISRDATLEQAEAAMKSIASGPVNFDSDSRLIFSVIKRGATTGTTNFDRLILYQRREFGSIPGTSALRTVGAGSFSGPPNYEAVNSDGNANLQLTNVGNLVLVPGGMIYVTEIFTRHDPITPFDRFGVTMPRTLYSIAYF
jgi:TadE-like protein